MKLQILVPHYHESVDVVMPLLDSIALQQSIDFDDVGVIICHDGRDIPVFEFKRGYPFEILQIAQDHKGVSAARNACLDASKAEYVMFCDADDMFYNACGLWIVFREMASGGFDSLVSCFTEETRNPATGETEYINHDADSTFVHGKIHRREYLLKNNVRWNEKLTIHEDSFFNIQCQNYSQNVKYCSTPFYLWKWRDESVCRHDPKYILKTYEDMLDSNDALIDEFLKRGMQDKAIFYTVFMIFDAYYTMNKPEWINQENRQYRNDTEYRFKQYFRKHKDFWKNAPSGDKMMISNQVRSRSIAEGMQMEAVTIDSWLRHIERIKRVKRN